MDLEKAFDSIPRRKVWEYSTKRKVDSKLIWMIKALYKDTWNKAINKNAESNMFLTNEGVRQDDSLSLTLFVIFIDEPIKEANRKAKPFHVGLRNLQRIDISQCAFADDIAIMGKSENFLKEKLEIWNAAVTNNGIKLNKAKTKQLL